MKKMRIEKYRDFVATFYDNGEIHLDGVDGMKNIKYPNGDVEHVSNEGIVCRKFMDGKVRYMYPDGTCIDDVVKEVKVDNKFMEKISKFMDKFF